MIKDNSLPLETERLILRELRLSDAANIQRYAGAVEIARGTLTMPHPYEDGMAEDFIRSMRESRVNGITYTFGITVKPSDAVVGCISIGNHPQYRRGEAGYWIGVPFWGKGYVTEALTRIIQFGFDDLNLNRILAYHFTDNPASGRVMQKVGMTYEGTLRQHVIRFDDFKDLACYGLLREEYR